VPANVDAFEYLMQLPGISYRELDGRRTALCQIGGRPYFLKTHVGVGWREIVKNLIQLRLPVISAKTEYVAINLMPTLEIESMQCVAFAQRGVNPATLRSFIITRALENTISLEDLMLRWQQEKPTVTSRRLKRSLINRVADIARRLHQNGVNHRDLYLCHFRLPETDLASGELTHLYLMDLHRAQIRETTPARWQIKDLAGLHFSSMNAGLTRSDRYRFMCRYCQTDLATTLSDSKLWHGVAQRAKKTYQKFHSNPTNAVDA
jgi:heptose I phosphotransferase